MPTIISERWAYVTVLENAERSFLGMDTLVDTRFSAASSYSILPTLSGVREDGLLTDDMLVDSINVLQERLAYYRGNNRLENAVRTLSCLAQCCWYRHWNFRTVPVTATFPFCKQAEQVYCQIRMENLVFERVEIVCRQTLFLKVYKSRFSSPLL